jgi:hypothetical protein
MYGENGDYNFEQYLGKNQLRGRVAEHGCR